MIRFRSVSTLVLTATVVAALVSGAWAQDTVPRILNGTPTNDFESVGIVGSRQYGGFCTGTLISPYHVLTAAHCAEEIESATAGTFELESGVYSTQAIFVHPDYNRFTLENDVAILELSEAAIELPSFVFDGTPLPGDELILVGFGGGGDADGGDGTFGLKMFGFVNIDVVEPTLLIWIFDDPLESNTSPGDSGGPGFIDIGGELLIASITSGGSLPDAALGDVAFNTRVDAYVDWIDTIILSMPTGPDDGSEDDSTDENPPTGGGCFGGDFWEAGLGQEIAAWFDAWEFQPLVISWFQSIQEWLPPLPNWTQPLKQVQPDSRAGQRHRGSRTAAKSHQRTDRRRSR